MLKNIVMTANKENEADKCESTMDAFVIALENLSVIKFQILLLTATFRMRTLDSIAREMCAI